MPAQLTEFLNINGFLIVSMVFAALLGLSLYLPLMAGQLSLASSGFYALGGYVAAIMSTKVFTVPAGESFPVLYIVIEMLIAGLLCGVVAIIIGIPTLRLRGIYLALATIAFIKILEAFALNLEITGTASGIFGIPQAFRQKFEYMWFAAPMLLATIFILYRLERTRVGRAFTALREDELAAAAMGISPTYFKVLAFTLGAILAGMVGAVSAHVLNTWNARQGTFDASILHLAFVLIGGSRTFWGPIVGGIVLTALPEILRSISGTPGLPIALSQFLKEGRYLIFGILIAVSTLFFPQGIITPALFKRHRRPPTDPTPVPSATIKPDKAGAV